MPLQTKSDHSHPRSRCTQIEDRFDAFRVAKTIFVLDWDRLCQVSELVSPLVLEQECPHPENRKSLELSSAPGHPVYCFCHFLSRETLSPLLK